MPRKVVPIVCRIAWIKVGELEEKRALDSTA